MIPYDPKTADPEYIRHAEVAEYELRVRTRRERKETAYRRRVWLIATPFVLMVIAATASWYLRK